MLQAHAVRIIINRLIVSIPVYTDTSICISRIHAYVTYYTIVCLLKKLFFLSRNKRRPPQWWQKFIDSPDSFISVYKYTLTNFPGISNKRGYSTTLHIYILVDGRNVSETLAVFRLASKYICSLFHSLVIRLLSANLCSAAINSQRNTQLWNYTAS